MPNTDLIGVAFAHSGPEAEMIQGLLESNGIPSALQSTGVEGPMLGVGLSPTSAQRVVVRADQAEAARRVLADVAAENEWGIETEPVNARYLDEAMGRRVRNYGVIGAYARALSFSLVVLGVAFVIFLLFRA